MQIANKGLRISFLNVHPGFNERVERKLSDWRESQRVEWLRIYIALGIFDTVVITPLETQKKRAEILPLYIDGEAVVTNSILAFGLEGLPNNRLEEVLEGDILLISAVKLNQSIVKLFGLDAEDKISRYICDHVPRDEREPVKVAVMGTFGWHELVLLLSGSDVGKLISTLLDLRQRKCCDVDQKLGVLSSQGISRAGEELFVLETSFTVAAINQRFARNVLMKLPSSENRGNAINVRITVICKPGKSNVIAKGIQKHFGTEANERSPLGKGEIVFSRELFLEDLLRKLESFRKEFANEIQSTETSIEMPIRFTDEPIQLSNQLGIITLAEPKLSRIKEFDVNIYNRLLQAFASFNQVMSDELQFDAFADQIPFIEQLTSEIPRIGAEGGLSLEYLTKSCLLYKYGVDQRFAGSYLSWLKPNPLPTVQHEGGIQRILLSVRQVIKEVLDRGGINFTGFPIFGWMNDPRVLEFGVINLPMYSLLWPNDWFLTFHEAGHQYVLKLDPESDSELQNLFLNNVGFNPAKVEYKEIRQAEPDLAFYEEIVADLIDFLVGFDKQWRDYLLLTWSYFVPTGDVLQRPEMLNQHLTRMLLIKRLTVQWDTVKATLEDPDQFRVWWRDLILEILSLETKKIIEGLAELQLNPKYANSAYSLFVKWFAIHKHLGSKLEKLLSREEVSHEDSKAVLERIKEGRPVANISSGIALIKELSLAEIRGEEMGFAARAAVCLSLWSTHVQQLPARTIYDIKVRD